MMGNFLADHTSAILIVLCAVVFVLIVMQLNTWQKLRRLQALKRRLDRLVMVDEPVSLGDLLTKLNGQMSALHERQDGLEDMVAKIHTAFAHTIVRTGLVRFDAFGEGQEPLSFALCFLDPDQNGILMTEIRSLSTGALYAKEIRAGVSKEPLSPEEAKALDLALGR